MSQRNTEPVPGWWVEELGLELGLLIALCSVAYVLRATPLGNHREGLWWSWGSDLSCNPTLGGVPTPPILAKTLMPIHLTCAL